MQLDLTKDARQRRLFMQWVALNCIGSFLAATGFGKTRVGLMAAQYVRELTDEVIVIAVPSVYLKNKWRNDVKSWGIDNVVVETVHALVNGTIKNAALLILDEFHTYSAPVFGTVFECVEYQRVLGMTATLRKKPEDTEFLTSRAPVFDVVTLHECLSNGWVSPFVVYNLGIDLSAEDQAAYEKVTNRFKAYFSTFNYDFDLAMNCMSSAYESAKYAKELNWDAKAVRLHAYQWNKAMQTRKSFLYMSPTLVDVSKNIVEAFPERKIICFSQSTMFADALAFKLRESHIPVAVYHSNLKTQIVDGKKVGKTRLQRRALDDFISDKVQVLSTAKALNQGVDIPDADMSILSSYTSVELDSIQQTGRIIRVSDDKLKVAREVNLYFNGTQSEKWLRAKQQQTPQVRWISDIAEIT